MRDSSLTPSVPLPFFFSPTFDISPYSFEERERDGKIGFQKNVQQIEKNTKWVILVPIQHQIKKPPFSTSSWFK